MHLCDLNVKLLNRFEALLTFSQHTPIILNTTV